MRVSFFFFNQYRRWISPVYYQPTKSEGYIYGVVCASVRPFRPSTFFVRPEPYLSTSWSDLNHSLYK